MPDDFSAKVFYPFTFPITAGPGSLVVMVTLSAHAAAKGLTDTIAYHSGSFSRPSH